MRRFITRGHGRANTRDNTFNQGRKWFRPRDVRFIRVDRMRAQVASSRARIGGERVFFQIYPLSLGYYIHAAAGTHQVFQNTIGHHE